MSQPAVSKHLKVLERAGLISRGRDAQRRPVPAGGPPLEVATDWLEAYRAVLGGELPATRRAAGGDQGGRGAGTGAEEAGRDRQRRHHAVESARSFSPRRSTRPARLVFDAFTKPELLVRWYGARGWHLVVCEVDLRVGGAWRFVSRGPGRREMAQTGIVPRVTRPDAAGRDECSTTSRTRARPRSLHEFIERDEGTTVNSTLRFATAAGRDIVSLPHGPRRRRKLPSDSTRSADGR